MREKLFSFKNIGLAMSLLLLASCASEECAECHLVVENSDGSETELMELGEYCEDALHDIEEEGYVIQDTIFVDTDGNNLQSPVAPGDAVEVHCGEEHDH